MLTSPVRIVALLLAAVTTRAAIAQCPNGTPPPCASRAVIAAVARNSVAVLPFASRSADTADVYLAEGIAEELANQLASTGRLQLKALTTSAAQFRRTPDPVEAGRRLGVAWIVTGTVRRAGEQLLVNASLLKVASADQAWGSRFTRTVADIFAVQAEVAESVTVAVVGRLAPEERRTLARAPTTDKEAYRLYLLGKSLVARRSQPDVRRGVQAFEQAVSRDRRFAAGWASLAYARSLQYIWQWIESISRDSILTLAGAAAKRAIALDSLSAEAWAASAFHAMQQRDLWIAQAQFERSIALDSLKAETWHAYGQLYNSESKLVDYARAAPLMRRALALDPTLRNTWRQLGVSAYYAGRLPEAEALLDTALSFGPWDAALRGRAEVRFGRGNARGAIADLEEANRLEPFAIANLRALFSVALGDSAPARAVVEGLRLQADSATGLRNYARFAMALGYRSEALDVLERLRASREPDSFAYRCAPSTPCSPSLITWTTLHEPLFAPLRGDPRFERLWDETRPRVPWLTGVR